MSDETPTGGLFIPNRIRKLIEALPPETRKKLSLYELDLIEKFYADRLKDLDFYRQRRGELVIERDKVVAKVVQLECKLAELRAAQPVADEQITDEQADRALKRWFALWENEGNQQHYRHCMKEAICAALGESDG